MAPISATHHGNHQVQLHQRRAPGIHHKNWRLIAPNNAPKHLLDEEENDKPQPEEVGDTLVGEDRTPMRNAKRLAKTTKQMQQVTRLSPTEPMMKRTTITAATTTNEKIRGKHLNVESPKK
jgi:hypothetical protein